MPKNEIEIQVEYMPTTQRINADDVAGNLDPDATDEQIEKEIREHLSDVLSDAPWPSYRTCGVEDLVALVRARLAAAEGES
jgi:hypothetical protein